MTIYHCMDKEEIKKFIDIEIQGINDKGQEEIYKKIYLARSWDITLGALTYLLAQIMIANNRSINEKDMVIWEFYKKTNELYLEIHECDRKFIDYMIKSEGYQTAQELTDMLIGIQINVRESKSVRPLHN